MQSKFTDLIEFYNKQLNSYQFGLNSNEESQQKAEKSDHKSAIIMSSEQNEKFNLVIKIFIYYKQLVEDLITKNLNVDSNEWRKIPKFYFVKDTDTRVIIKIFDFEINYGFQYYSCHNDDECTMIYQSKQVESILSHLVNIIQSKASSLLHGKKVKIKRLILNLKFLFNLFKNKSLLRCLSQFLGYENHFYLCSEYTTSDSLNNICKAMVISGYWITFMNLNNLSLQLMSALSNVLTQVNERKDSILINNDPYTASQTLKNSTFTYFATIEPFNCSSINSHIDSLRITKIDHYFNLISKDLFEKFRIVKSDFDNLKNYLSLNFMSNGFSQNELLTNEILRIVKIYNSMLQSEAKKSCNLKKLHFI